MQVLTRFSISLWPALVTLTAFLILCKLGFWQLDRAREKADWLKQFSSQSQVDMQTLNQVISNQSFSTLNGRDMQLKGQVLTQYVWFVDNKIHQGQPGYKVLVPLLVPAVNSVIMMDLGWIKAPKSRMTLPQFDLPQTLQTDGVIKSEQLEQFVLKKDVVSDKWPQRIQSSEGAFSTNYGYPLLPIIFYANSLSVNQMPQTYKAVVMPPEKHVAYAVQWFLLALACVLVFLFASYKRPVLGKPENSLEVS